MDPQQPLRRIPKIRFRVLIIGRANAGKTSILQRVCDTTDSPYIYRGREEVTLEPSMDRGEHTIDDELVFANHTGYIFHDSRAIESGSAEELASLRDFIQRKCRKTRLQDRIHAIWYCIPTDNQRPQLDLRFFEGICPDQNVPVIAVFTKYEQFRRNIRFHVEDFGSPDDDVSQATEKLFQENYLRPLGDGVRFVRLEKMHQQNMRCDELIETTAAALNDETTALMLLAVQRSNLELSVKTALDRVHYHTGNDSEVKRIVQECLLSFPYIWLFDQLEEELDELESLESDEGSLGSRLRERLDELRDFFDRRDFLIDDDDDRRRRDRRRDDRRRRRRIDRDGAILLSLLGRKRLGDIDLIFDFESLRAALQNIMSLPTITNLTATSLDRNHLALAVIIILMHATLLHLSNLSPESALTQAELEYREANIDSKIRQHLTASSSQEHSVHLFASFIMATELKSSNSSRDQYSRAR